MGVGFALGLTIWSEYVSNTKAQTTNLMKSPALIAVILSGVLIRTSATFPIFYNLTKKDLEPIALWQRAKGPAKHESEDEDAKKEVEKQQSELLRLCFAFTPQGKVAGCLIDAG